MGIRLGAVGIGVLGLKVRTLAIIIVRFIASGWHPTCFPSLAAAISDGGVVKVFELCVTGGSTNSAVCRKNTGENTSKAQLLQQAYSGHRLSKIKDV